MVGARVLECERVRERDSARARDSAETEKTKSESIGRTFPRQGHRFTAERESERASETENFRNEFYRQDVPARREGWKAKQHSPLIAKRCGENIGSRPQGGGVWFMGETLA